MVEKRIFVCGCWQVYNTVDGTSACGFCGDVEGADCERGKVELEEWLDKQLSGIGVTGDELQAAIDRAKALGVVVVLGDPIEEAQAAVDEDRGIDFGPIPFPIDYKREAKDNYRRGYDEIDWND